MWSNNTLQLNQLQTHYWVKSHRHRSVHLREACLVSAHIVDRTCIQNTHTFAVRHVAGAIRVATNSMQLVVQQKQN